MMLSWFALATASFGQTATTNTPTNVTPTTATLNGQVNAGGNPQNVTFQLGLSTDASGTYSLTAPTASPATVSGSSATSVSGAVTNLTAGTQYKYRVNIESGGTTINGTDVSFTTPTASVTTGNASSITSVSATLNGTATPTVGTVTNIRFEYGVTTAYGATVNASQTTATTANTAVTGSAVSLSANTTYNFRVIGTDSLGNQIVGQNATFNTLTTSGGDGDGGGGTPSQGGGAGILVYDLNFKHIAGFGIDFFEDGYVVVPATGGDGSVIFLGSDKGKRVYTRQEGVKFFTARTRSERYSVITMTGTTGAAVSMQAYGKADDKLKAEGKDYIITVKAARTMQGLAQAAYDESKASTAPVDGTLGFVEFSEMKLSLNSRETDRANDQARTVDSTTDNLVDIVEKQRGYVELELTTTSDTTTDTDTDADTSN